MRVLRDFYIWLHRWHTLPKWSLDEAKHAYTNFTGSIWPTANLQSNWYLHRGASSVRSLLQLSVLSANLTTRLVSNTLEPVSVGGHCKGVHDSRTPCNDKLPFLHTAVSTVVGESTMRWQRWGLKLEKDLYKVMFCDSTISQHTRHSVFSHLHNKGRASSFDLHTTSCLIFLDVCVS